MALNKTNSMDWAGLELECAQVTTTSDVSIGGTLGITGNATFTANADVGGTLDVTGNTTLDAALISTAQTLSGAGAVNLTSLVTFLVTGAADALTLADGTAGQIKLVVMKTDGGDGTLTPSNLSNGTTITFDDVGDSALLVFDGAAWAFVAGNATLA